MQSESTNDIASGAQNRIDDKIGTSFCLTTFDPLYAAQVASWVRSDQELLWLAPGTSPPLTPAKVIDWGQDRRNRYLFWQADKGELFGYSELNPMPDRSTGLWIGHFILNPEARGRSYGAILARSLLSLAFDGLKATNVLLVVFPDNGAAIRCYQSVGFRTTGKEHKHFDASRAPHVLLRMEVDEVGFQDSLKKSLAPAAVAPLVSISAIAQLALDSTTTVSAAK